MGKLTPALVIARRYFYGNKEAEGVLRTSKQTHSLAAEPCSLDSLNPSFHLVLEGNELTFSISFLKTPN